MSEKNYESFKELNFFVTKIGNIITVHMLLKMVIHINLLPNLVMLPILVIPCSDK